MPWRRRRQYVVPCAGSGSRLTIGDRCDWRPGFYLCPRCKTLVHQRADGRAPAHTRVEVKF